MNRLQDSSSLYLRQHADNPVEWWTWNDAALAAARDLDRPILLSIGYSACHWCHVMAHESFEDEDTAAVMNSLFINIKVDREERPDLDRVYQLSHQLLTGRGGGWPLTVFLDPVSLAPFFAGTYFPPAPRHGMPPFTEVLRRVRAWFDDHRDEVRAINQRVDAGLAAIQAPGEARGDRHEVIEAAAGAAMARRDSEYGGYGAAPKFPQAPLLSLLRPLAAAAGDDGIANHLDFTLDQMARGGLRDQLDGGFFRYTVDHDWTIPHFEKMLYDNAQLLPLYAEAARRLDDPWLHEVATGIGDWLLDVMRGDDGAFAASIDADADGVEGGFHVWKASAVRGLLPANEWQVAKATFGLDGPANFEGEAWHLTRRGGGETGSELAGAIERLLAERSNRVPPARDTKRLGGWNALCAHGLAHAAVDLDRDDWLAAASDCVAFIERRLWTEDGLHTVYAAGEARHAACLDDYAFLLQAELTLLSADWSSPRLAFTARLADRLVDGFEDTKDGGFHFTDASEDVPMRRLKVVQDDATPAGAGIAALALLRLGHLLAESRWIDAASRAIDAARHDLERYPLGHASLVRALIEADSPPAQVVIRGSDPSEVGRWHETVRTRHRVHCYAPGADPVTTAEAGPLTTPPPDRGVVATVCVGHRCLPAVDRLAALEEQLRTRD